MRTFTALVNPIAGGGRAAARWAPLAERIRASGAQVHVEHTRSREHAVELAGQAAERTDVVLAVGGDGLVRDVAGGVVGTDASMGIVAAGRGNDLARVLGLPTDCDALATLLLDAPARAIDVLEVDGTVVPGNVYSGIDSVANAMINRSRWIPGALLYRLAPVRAIASWRAAGYTVVADGVARTVRAHTVVIANSGAYGHGLRIVPSAVVDDGLLDVMVVGDGPRSAIVRFMREAKHGTHVARGEVSVCTAREVTISADRALPVCGDGDQLGELPVTVRIRPAALNILAR
ncbi:MAG: diacylglycerol/lipid kinase family protein [Jatrophihabitantaceae bacterium]